MNVLTTIWNMSWTRLNPCSSWWYISYASVHDMTRCLCFWWCKNIPPHEVHPGGKSPLCWMRPKYRSIILIVDSILSSADAPLVFMFNPRICKKYAASQVGWSFPPILPVENWVQPLARKKHSHEVNQVTLSPSWWLQPNPFEKYAASQIKLDHFPTKIGVKRWSFTTTRYLEVNPRVQPQRFVLNGEWQDRLISTSSLGVFFCCFGRVGWRVTARLKKTCNDGPWKFRVLG